MRLQLKGPRDRLDHTEEARSANRRRAHRVVTSLEVLEHEDQVLRDLFARISLERGSEVEQRYEYGNCVKEVIRHLGSREASLRDVAGSIAGIEPLKSVAEHLVGHDSAMRGPYEDVGKMSRGIRGIDLNIGQDFDAAFIPLMEMVDSEIRWELGEAIPHIRWWQAVSGTELRFHGRRYVLHRAPTTLSRDGPRWYERAWIASRLLTVYDHLRDYPRAARRTRVE